MLTWVELYKVAIRKGMVRWTKSRRIERLSLRKSRKFIVVEGLSLTPRHHIIRRPEDKDHLYDCVEIDPKTTMVTGQELIDAN